MNDETIAMRGVCLRRSGREILRGIDWTVAQGQHWAVIGANGCGKTTLLKIVGGMLFPTAGEVTVLGGRFGSCDLMALRRRVAWVGPSLLARMPGHERLWDIVSSGLKATFGKVYELEGEDRDRVDACLARAGLGDRGDSPFSVLSQGEQQRALFARSLMSEPELFIMDEACSGLDIPSRERLLHMTDDVMREGKCSVMMVTHHIEEIPAGVSHALVLKEGRVLACGPAAETLTSNTLSEAFGLRVAVDNSNGRFWARVV
ncbi:MAG: ATP-binding cassette domain-containing protein [Planctomycetaceae bacterium]|nr:ATP-binding cassette domain-containing protein [Planctomycetaceae bacterium]